MSEQQTTTEQVQEKAEQALAKLQNIPLSRIIGYVILAVIAAIGMLIWQDVVYFAILFLTWKVVDKVWSLAFPHPQA